MFDTLRIALYVGVLAGSIAIGCLTYVGIENSGSRNISLALGTLFGAALLMAVQGYFELRGSKTFAVIGTEFTTDRATRKIEQWRYPLSALSRPTAESDANKFLLNTYPTAFDGDGEKLWRDMSLYSLVSYLWIEQHDWQTVWTKVKDYGQFQYSSSPDLCTKITLSRIQAMLKQSGNFFAEHIPLSPPFEFMCLPPRSSLDISSNAVGIKTPFNEILFVIEPQWFAAHYRKPGDQGDTPLLEDGHPRFNTRNGIIRATIKSTWLRAQHQQMPKYQTWASGVVDGARKWFDTEISGNWKRSDIE